MERFADMRAPRPLIEDRIDLRHRILDTLIDSDMNLKSPQLPDHVDRLDQLIWRDGDLRETRLRYDLFTTFRRKGIDLLEKVEKGARDPAALFESFADMLLARGTGLDFDGLGPNDIDQARADRIGEAIDMLTKINGRLVGILERMELTVEYSIDPPVVTPGEDLTGKSIGATRQILPASAPGTPGGKGKQKP